MELLIELEAGIWYMGSDSDQEHVKEAIDFISERKIKVKKGKAVMVGRRKENQIILHDNSVSRNH